MRSKEKNSSAHSDLKTSLCDASVETLNETGKSSVIIVCEHASSYVPAHYNNLGLAKQDLISHIAWDPGARDVALGLSEKLDAPLVAGCVSRLVYDCNRPPDSSSAMPEKSELTVIPGNQCLSTSQRNLRVEQVYQPFVNQLSSVIQMKMEQSDPLYLVTIHSFTPNYFGKTRAVELGILHDTDTRLADCMLNNLKGQCELNVQRNQPYGPQDGVTHTLKEHAIKHAMHNVMIEIRNDLLTTDMKIKNIVNILYSTLIESFDKVANTK